MFGSQILEVAAGLVLVYLVLSLIASSVREGIESWLKSRAVHLEQGIRELLHDPTGDGFTRRLFEHPMIFGLYRGGYTPSPAGTESVAGRMAKRWRTNLPSYIPSRNFAAALLDIAAYGDDAAKVLGAAPSLKDIRERAASMKEMPDPVRRAILNAIDTADGSVDRARKNLEAWYDSTMDRVSGWYKRETQRIVFVIAVVITVAVNANSLVIAEQLYRNGDTRRDVVAAAVARTSTSSPRDVALDGAVAEIADLELPLGWPVMTRSSSRFTRPLGIAAGWLLTAFAITLGAPFWFDVLNKIMVIRATVKPHEKSREEASADRQPEPAERVASRPPAVVLPDTATIPVGTPTSIVNAQPIAQQNASRDAGAPEEGGS